MRLALNALKMFASFTNQQCCKLTKGTASLIIYT